MVNQKTQFNALVQTGFEKKDDGITVINCPVIANLTASALLIAVAA